MTGWQRPPRALRKARLDNIAIVPASLLPQQAYYQAVANQLPAGDVLIVLPAPLGDRPTAITKAIALFEAKGHHVTTVVADVTG